MNQSIKRSPHPLAGSRVAIPGCHSCGEKYFVVKDWWVNVAGRSWKDCPDFSVCQYYGDRAKASGIPLDDEVVLGSVDGLDSIVHNSELVLAVAGERPEVPVQNLPKVDIAPLTLEGGIPGIGITITEPGDKPGDKPGKLVLATSVEHAKTIAHTILQICYRMEDHHTEY